MSFISKFENLCDQLRRIYRHPMAALVVLLLLTWSRLLSSSPADPDLFARLAAGRLVETLGFMPSTEPFAFSPTKPVWIDHEWLSGVVFWWVLSHCGESGLLALKLLSASLTVILLFFAARTLSPSISPPIVFWSLCLLQGLYAWGSTIRCQTFTYLFISFLFFALLQARERGVIRYLLFIPMISIPWVNLHGGYALGLVIMWAWTCVSLLTGRHRGLLIAVCILSSAASILTPYGFTAYSEYLLEALRMSRPTITEWAPLWTHPLAFVGLCATIAPIVWVIICSSKSVADIASLSLLALSTYMGVRHIRLEVFTMITCFVFGAPYIHRFSRSFTTWAPAFSERIARSVAAVGSTFVIVLAAEVIVALTSSSSFSLQLSNYPVDATNWMRSYNLQGRLLVDFNTGSFALWRLYPHFKISMDGRYEETYPAETEQLNSDAFKFGSAESRRALEILQPTHILIKHTGENPSSYAEALGDPWQMIYSDKSFALFGRHHFDEAAEIMPVDADNIWQPLF